MKTILLNIRRFIGRFILLLLGWQQCDPKDVQSIKETDRAIAVFSHSSYWDFFFMLVYMMAYPELGENLYVLIQPHVFKYFGFFLRRIGGISSSPLEQKQAGTTERIINVLKEKEKFLFLISPKGSIKLRPWRSGYYHIAKELNCFVFTFLNPSISWLNVMGRMNSICKTNGLFCRQICFKFLIFSEPFFLLLGISFSWHKRGFPMRKICL